MKTPRYTSAQLERLPKWAQTEIWILDRDLTDAQNKLRAIGENKPTRVKVGAYSETPRYLRDNEHIEFTLKEGKGGNKAEIEVRIEGDRLYFYANGLSGEDLAFIPRSSNTGFLALIKDSE